MTLTVHNGGRNSHPLAEHIANPVMRRARRAARDYDQAVVDQAVEAARLARLNLRPSNPPVEVLPGVTLFDRELEPDIPVLPLDVQLALSVLLRSAVPEAVSREHHTEAADIVAGYFRLDRDDCKNLRRVTL